jgi:hypothetical protein
MPMIDKLWLATLTKSEDDAGTDVDTLNLTININGEDVADMDFTFLSGSGWFSGGLGPDSDWLGEGQAALSGGTYDSPGEPVTSPFEANLLTNSSIRLGIRDDDAWGPQHILLLGQTQPAFEPGRIIALAMETELEPWLSTDSTEGKLTMPLRLVDPGSSSTLIRRVMLLVYTDSTGGTDSPIQLQITAAGNLVLQQQIPDTEQDDLEEYTGNWYFVDVPVPFTRGDVLANGGIRLIILGTESWLPKTLFLYGLDTAEGRPNEVVPLVSIPEWDLGSLGASQPSIPLPVF